MNAQPERPGDEQITGNAAAAARAGLTSATSWSSYVSRDYAPKPDGRHDGRTPWWWASTIDNWKKGRTGQGARTDLSVDDQPETPKGNT